MTHCCYSTHFLSDVSVIPLTRHQREWRDFAAGASFSVCKCVARCSFPCFIALREASRFGKTGAIAHAEGFNDVDR
jgi:hypothetical protein